MRRWDAKSWIAVTLTLTVCCSVLLTLGSMIYRGPDSIPAEGRSKMYELVTFIVGVISGWLASDTKKSSGPTHEPEDKA